MNKFRTFTLSFLFSLLIFTLSYGQTLSEPVKPSHTLGSFIYADIDTASQKLFVLIPEGLWKYDLVTESWDSLFDAHDLPDPIPEFDFAYDHINSRILMWSRGVGSVYEINPYEISIQRIDRSFDHKNQFGHFPFIRDGNTYAFGGYGYWKFKDYITLFNPEVSEWNIVSVSPESSFPPPMIPENGFYNSISDELYIHGGHRIENNRQDDYSAVKFFSNDIWKFSFSDATWTKIGSILHDDVSPYRSSNDGKFGVSNSASRSIYSPNSNTWYIPVKYDNKPDGIYHLAPFDLDLNTEYPYLEIPFGKSKPFLISNYLFNPKTQSAIFVGIENQTNNETSPISIKIISENTLINAIHADNGRSTISYFIYTTLVGVIILFGYLFYKYNKTGSDEAKLRQYEILNNNTFNESEKKLLRVLMNQNENLDTQSLEEKVWPEINNYDYRRKIRNETINSINKKYSKISGSLEELIVRSKDPNDNRRYLYGLTNRSR